MSKSVPAVFVAAVLAGCSAPGGVVSADDDAASSSAPQAGQASDDADSSAAADDADSAGAESDSDSAGAESDSGGREPDIEFPDEPEPNDQLAATLCNLDRDYFMGLRSADSAGAPVADDRLRMSVLSLGDNLSLWNDLGRSFPEAEPDIERAQRVYDLWDEALLHQDNGDFDSASSAMAQAEEQLEKLPESAPDAVEGC